MSSSQNSQTPGSPTGSVSSTGSARLRKNWQATRMTWTTSSTEESGSAAPQSEDNQTNAVDVRGGPSGAESQTSSSSAAPLVPEIAAEFEAKGSAEQRNRRLAPLDKALENEQGSWDTAVESSPGMASAVGLSGGQADVGASGFKKSNKDLLHPPEGAKGLKLDTASHRKVEALEVPQSKLNIEDPAWLQAGAQRTKGGRRNSADSPTTRHRKLSHRSPRGRVDSSLFGLGPETPLSLTSVSPSDSFSDGEDHSTSDASGRAKWRLSSGRMSTARFSSPGLSANSGEESEDTRMQASTTNAPQVSRGAMPTDYVWNEFRKNRLNGKGLRIDAYEANTSRGIVANAKVLLPVSTSRVDEAGESQSSWGSTDAQQWVSSEVRDAETQNQSGMQGEAEEPPGSSRNRLDFGGDLHGRRSGSTSASTTPRTQETGFGFFSATGTPTKRGEIKNDTVGSDSGSSHRRTDQGSGFSKIFLGRTETLLNESERQRQSSTMRLALHGLCFGSLTVLAFAVIFWNIFSPESPAQATSFGSIKVPGTIWMFVFVHMSCCIACFVLSQIELQTCHRSWEPVLNFAARERIKDADKSIARRSKRRNTSHYLHLLQSYLTEYRTAERETKVFESIHGPMISVCIFSASLFNLVAVAATNIELPRWTSALALASLGAIGSLLNSMSRISRNLLNQRENLLFLYAQGTKLAASSDMREDYETYRARLELVLHYITLNRQGMMLVEGLAIPSELMPKVSSLILILLLFNHQSIARMWGPGPAALQTTPGTCSNSREPTPCQTSHNSPITPKEYWEQPESQSQSLNLGRVASEEATKEFLHPTTKDPSPNPNLNPDSDPNPAPTHLSTPPTQLRHPAPGPGRRADSPTWDPR